MRYDALVVMGPPGAGTGTLCCQLERLDGTVHFPCDDDVADDAVVESLRERLAGHAPGGSLLLLENVPRTLAQMDLLEEFVDVKGVVGLYAPHATLLARMSARDERPADWDPRKAFGRIREYERKTLPVLPRYSRMGKPCLVMSTDELTDSVVFDRTVYRFAAV